MSDTLHISMPEPGIEIETSYPVISVSTIRIASGYKSRLKQYKESTYIDMLLLAAIHCQRQIKNWTIPEDLP